MANPMMARVAWGRLSRKMTKKAGAIVRELKIRRVNKEQAREIALIAAELNVPRKNLVMLLMRHFEAIKQANRDGKPLEWAQQMQHDLVRVRELIRDTNPDRKALWQNLMRKPLAEVLKEMEQYAQQMEAAQAAA